MSAPARNGPRAFGGLRDVPDPSMQIADAVQVNDQGVVRGPPLLAAKILRTAAGLEAFAPAVDGFGGEGNQVARPQRLDYAASISLWLARMSEMIALLVASALVGPLRRGRCEGATDIGLSCGQHRGET